MPQREPHASHRSAVAHRAFATVATTGGIGPGDASVDILQDPMCSATVTAGAIALVSIGERCG